ncbi:MAG: hypothetical protein ACLQB4_07710 [Beijerinckiaceae bacterium]
MRLFKRAREIFQHKSKSRELRAEVEALRYLVKILLTSMVSGEPRQADQELQHLVAATRYVKSRADDEDRNGTTEQLTERARAKALEVIEAVRSAIMQ